MKKPTLIAVDGKTVPPKNTPDKNALDFYRELETDVLARTLWGEARGEGDKGMEAVACVIMNRVRVAEEKGRYWWGNNIIQVCQKPYQFSCWNRSDPNFKKVQAVDSTDYYFASALRIARRVIGQCQMDITNGATHYHADSIAKPFWAKGQEPRAVIGHHIFYRIIEE
ncbi:MAG: cell wall hydrolase [Alphaproteobacteria bacterium]|nr:cell wall hydrolase [Alphaproteobacteria bacterium]MCD8570054.1 cell wall hydrolase [Alphaproteobacteria bacterium]